MGYDMSIEDPDPEAAKEYDRLQGILYGIGGGGARDESLYTRLWAVPEGDRGERDPDADQWEIAVKQYKPGTGTPEWEDLRRQVVETSEAVDEVEGKNYFRLNIWGMDRCRGYMDHFGMAYDAERGGWEDFWPKATDYGFGDDESPWEEEVYDTESGTTSYTTERARLFHEANEAARAREFDGVGIPFHKLGSNDGWLVTEKECADALSMLAANGGIDAGGKVVPITDKYDGVDQEVLWWPRWVAFLAEASTHGGFRVY
jgi:hypothetical protein